MSDTIRVQVTYDADRGDGVNIRTSQTLELPGWCSGDPEHGAALYLFGYAAAAETLDMIARVED